MHDIEKCKACGQPIKWINGTPIDPKPTEDGDVATLTGEFYMRSRMPERLAAIYNGCFYTQHVKTCPKLNPKDKK